jgi:23S rRNA (cytosine1962-C5)-methyltransferase
MNQNRMSSNDYELLQAGDFMKLERFGPWVIERPSLYAVWPLKGIRPKATHSFSRSKDSSSWSSRESMQPFKIGLDGIRMEIRFTDFGHLGLFAEHRKIGQHILDVLKPEMKVLNLFAYTGYLSLLLAKEGAMVDHVDSSKASVEWAKINAELNGLKNIRWITEDVRSYVKRQIKRGQSYDMIILDPPSFGRGEKSQVWKIEDDLYALLLDLYQLRSANFKNIYLSCHSEGYGPFALAKLLNSAGFEAKNYQELYLDGDNIRLPSGAFACL